MKLRSFFQTHCSERAKSRNGKVFSTLLFFVCSGFLILACTDTGARTQMLQNFKLSDQHQTVTGVRSSEDPHVIVFAMAPYRANFEYTFEFDAMNPGSTTTVNGTPFASGGTIDFQQSNTMAVAVMEDGIEQQYTLEHMIDPAYVPIETQQDFDKIRDNPRGWFYLKNEIDLGVQNFLPLTAGSEEFSGKFLGRGLRIYHLNIAQDPTQALVGFFRTIGSDGLVRDLIFENVGQIKGSEHVGVLAGLNKGSIINVHVAAQEGVDAKVEGSTDAAYIGGLAGKNSGDITRSSAAIPVSGLQAIGGLIGINSGEISSSHAAGSVSGKENVGGLAGVNAGIISDVYATGEILGSDLAVSNLGGLVGLNEHRVTRAYAIGKIEPRHVSIGGLIGRLNSGATVTRSYFDSRTTRDNAIGYDEDAASVMTDTMMYYIDRTDNLVKNAPLGIRSTTDPTLSVPNPDAVAITEADFRWDFVGNTADGSKDVWRMTRGTWPVFAWQ